jgi:hypothetical protein
MPGETVKLHHWEDPESGNIVEFAAVLVSPLEGAPPEDEIEYLPLAFYYSGLGHKVENILQKMPDWRAIAQEPFVLVVPARPAGKWWFIKEGGGSSGEWLESGGGWQDWGSISGDFDAEGVELFNNWMEHVVSHPGIDVERIGLFGFSAGAYAVTELLAASTQSEIRFSGVGLGGVHGHGQSDLDALPRKRREGVTERFAAFLERLHQHEGFNWIEATHAESDTMCRWQDAGHILGALSERQLELGLLEVSLRLLDDEGHDTKPGSKKNKSNHDYFKAAFLRAEFLQALLGGTPPAALPRPAPQLPRRATPSRLSPQQRGVLYIYMTESSKPIYKKRGLQVTLIYDTQLYPHAGRIPEGKTDFPLGDLWKLALSPPFDLFFTGAELPLSREIFILPAHRKDTGRAPHLSWVLQNHIATLTNLRSDPEGNRK